jgi:hypothetical protein
VPDVRLLAVDIDGTLLDSGGRLPDAHRDALAEASAQGIALALVTGRSFHFARPVAKRLGLASTLIVNNGAAVKAATGQTLTRHVLPRDLARRVLDEARDYQDSVAVVFDREPGADETRQIVFEHMNWSDPNRWGYYQKNSAYICRTSPLESALVEEPIQVMFNGSVSRMRALMARLRQLPEADRMSVAATEYEHRDFSLVDVNRGGCSKGSTLAQWAATCGCEPSQVMAVGDNLNDLEMLRFAGVEVVMGNAAQSLKGHGFHETSSNNEGGLAIAIRKLALRSAR